ncbi:MAG: tRNA (N(6)-L-threonylcarbamoyladenosine(37)-C(2))-methylthiotransferase MtaB [bacterium]|jgi:threonylcarbamoyladenosine tRNA methylthiotransferase MtaB|nr:tRNA (N(6)-L-threonylcarbamoyladenosine(37)-C(2))-methylthiotransferase MtaB [bacterium]
MDAPLQQLQMTLPRSLSAPLPSACSTAVHDAGRILRVAFRTLGCRLNQYDTESLRLRLGELTPMRVVPWDEPADLYILNSCTVTAKAEHECRRLARQAKQRHPGCRVVVAGCYAQTQPDALARLAEIDAVVGNATKDDVAAWLPAALGEAGPRVQAAPFAAQTKFYAPLVDAFPGRSRAFVKVQDGCNLRCTYCAIWQARGPGRSRSTADVVAQLERLARAGYREAVLTGVHLGGWGRDTGEGRLPDLLRSCLAELPDMRLRLSSIHPNEVGPALLELCATEPRLRPHLHLSLQSGSDSVLRRMKRPYRGAGARRAVAAAASLGDHWGIGADFIVGFPGETDAEFADTLRLVEDQPFSYVHVFRYSARPGTVAAGLAGAVPGPVVSERAAALRELSGAKRARFRSLLLGRACEAIVENGSEVPGCHQATTDSYETVMIPMVDGDGLHPGAPVNVRIEHEHDGRLYARAV